MSRRTLQTAARPHSLWLRALAFVCVWVVAAVGSAQAVHIHGQWLPHAAAHADAPATATQLPGGEEHCPLCVAMHAALPVSMHAGPAETTLVLVRLVEPIDHVAQAPWHYARFSRPPPTS